MTGYYSRICVYGICKNESKNVIKHIESIAKADLIYVLDTGSTDDTFNTLKYIVDNEDKINIKLNNIQVDVEQFPTGIDFDFSEARNMALNNAKELCKVIDSDINNWLFISLDFDEFLDDTVIDRLRHEVKNEGTQKADLVMLLGESPNEGTETFIDTKVHSWDFVWYRNVHETIRHTSGKKYKELKIYKPALPYKYFHYQDLTKKRNYYELLKKGFEKDPTDIKTATYLCWEAILHNDYEGLEKYVNQLLSNIIGSKYDDLYGDPQYSIQAYKYLSILYKHTGEKAKRINALRNAICIAITNFYDIRILHHMLADAYWSTDDKESAIKEYEAELEIKEYRDCWVDDKSLYKSGEVYSKLSTAYYYVDDICNSIYYGVYATKVEPNNQLYKKNLDSIVKGFRSKILSNK